MPARRRSSRGVLSAWMVLALVPGASTCHASSRQPVDDDPKPPRVDVKFREGLSLDDPLGLLPRELRSRIVRVAPLVTQNREELERMGAGRMARWFRFELAPGTDVEKLLRDLKRLEVVEEAERAPEPAPPPEEH